MDPLRPLKFDRPIGSLPEPTKMKVVLPEDEPTYTNILGRDPQLLLGTAHKGSLKTAASFVARARLPGTRISLGYILKLAPWVTLFVAGAVFTAHLISGPRP